MCMHLGQVVPYVFLKFKQNFGCGWLSPIVETTFSGTANDLKSTSLQNIYWTRPAHVKSQKNTFLKSARGNRHTADGAAAVAAHVQRAVDQLSRSAAHPPPLPDLGQIGKKITLQTIRAGPAANLCANVCWNIKRCAKRGALADNA
jgi:hypothetical protein